MTDPYLDALALDRPVGQRRSRRAIEKRRLAALARAHALRQFEIENYWKRANYFWLFQVAAFTLLGFILSGKSTQNQGVLLLLPTALGALTAFSALLTARGSKFWQENWEAHVDALEEAVEGRMTQVVLNRKGLRASVTRVNEALLIVIMLAWFAAFVAVLIAPELDGRGIALFWADHNWMAGLALIGATAFIGYYGRGRFSGLSAPTFGGRWTRFGTSSPRRSQIVIRDTIFRDAKPPKGRAPY